MKIAKQIPAILLGVVFLGFGLAYFFKLMPEQKMEGDTLAYIGLMGKSGYMDFVKILEVIFGLLLFIPKTKALGLILIAPICVNILCFELFIAKQPGIGIALVLINAVAIYLDKKKYSSILA